MKVMYLTCIFEAAIYITTMCVKAVTKNPCAQM